MSQTLKHLISACLLSSTILATPILAETTVDENSNITWSAGLGGVSMEFEPDGSLSKIYSQFYQPVGIADRRGISKARKIAETKAKAEIVRFMEGEFITSNRIITEVENSLANTTQNTSGDETTISDTVQRQMIENVSEITTSSASGLIRGIITLESGYDEEAKEVWVTVGLSQKTLRAAAQGRELLASDPLTDDQAEESSNVESNQSAKKQRVVNKYSGDF